MRPPLTPIQACAGETTAQRPSCLEINAKSLKHFCSSQGDVVSVVAAFRIGGQPSQCPQAVVERYADRARHVIVASSCGPQPAWRVGREFAATNTREHAQPFKRTGHIRSFET